MEVADQKVGFALGMVRTVKSLIIGQQHVTLLSTQTKWQLRIGPYLAGREFG
ncbi:unnamed protein product, partial [Allacma fusca]